MKSKLYHLNICFQVRAANKGEIKRLAKILLCGFKRSQDVKYAITPVTKPGPEQSDWRSP